MVGMWLTGGDNTALLSGLTVDVVDVEAYC